MAPPAPAIASQTRIPGPLWRVLLVLSVAINYIDRGNLSIAAPLLKDELGISATQLGSLLSALFWTYSTFQIVSGWLVDRLNVTWVLAVDSYCGPPLQRRPALPTDSRCFLSCGWYWESENP